MYSYLYYKWHEVSRGPVIHIPHGITCTLHEYHKHTTWVSHAHQVDITCASYGTYLSHQVYHNHCHILWALSSYQQLPVLQMAWDYWVVLEDLLLSVQICEHQLGWNNAELLHSSTGYVRKYKMLSEKVIQIPHEWGMKYYSQKINFRLNTAIWTQQTHIHNLTQAQDPWSYAWSIQSWVMMSITCKKTMRQERVVHLCGSQAQFCYLKALFCFGLSEIYFFQ